MRKVWITPKPGFRVMDPTVTPVAPLPADGIEKEDGAYWRRRERMGEVEISATKPVKKGK